MFPRRSCSFSSRGPLAEFCPVLKGDQKNFYAPMFPRRRYPLSSRGPLAGVVSVFERGPKNFYAPMFPRRSCSFSSRGPLAGILFLKRTDGPCKSLGIPGIQEGPSQKRRLLCVLHCNTRAWFYKVLSENFLKVFCSSESSANPERRRCPDLRWTTPRNA